MCIHRTLFEVNAKVIVLATHALADEKNAAFGSSESVYRSQSASRSFSSVSKELAGDVKETLYKNQTSGMYSSSSA